MPPVKATKREEKILRSLIKRFKNSSTTRAAVKLTTKNANKNPDPPLGKPWMAPSNNPTIIISQNNENDAANNTANAAVTGHGAKIVLRNKMIKDAILKTSILCFNVNPCAFAAFQNNFKSFVCISFVFIYQP